VWVFEEQQRVWLPAFFDSKLSFLLHLKRRAVFDAA
jgi:hypothetical protein